MNLSTRRNLLTGKFASHERQVIELGLIHNTIGNLDLYALPIEHDYNTWQVNERRIVDLVGHFPTLIPEYFPPEYAALDSSSFGLLGQYKEANYLFHALDSVAHKGGKELYVLDPAYDAAMVAFRALGATSSLGLAAMSAKLGVGLVPKSKQESEGVLDLNKRELLKGMSAIALGSSLGGSAAGLSWVKVMGIENDIRRVIVAEQLARLGEVLGEKKKALLIYPPEHWRWISLYLGDPVLRDKQLRAYAPLRDVGFSNLFVGRNYKPTEEGWVLANSFVV